MCSPYDTTLALNERTPSVQRRRMGLMPGRNQQWYGALQKFDGFGRGKERRDAIY